TRLTQHLEVRGVREAQAGTCAKDQNLKRQGGQRGDSRGVEPIEVRYLPFQYAIGQHDYAALVAHTVDGDIARPVAREQVAAFRSRRVQLHFTPEICLGDLLG